MDPKELQETLDSMPDLLKEVRARRGSKIKLEEMLPGEKNAQAREDVRTKGYFETVHQGKPVKIGVAMTDDGYVLATAAAVERTPDRSLDYIRNVRDFQVDQSTRRSDKIALFYRVVGAEGLLNNAVNKSAALVSTEGNYHIRRAKKGKRPRGKVRDELTALLNWWKHRVNSRPEGAITGARGLTQIMEQGTRQALIEGSYIGVWHPKNVYVPPLEGNFILPMFIQSISTQYIEIPEDLVGLGHELFYWVPPRRDLQRILDPGDPEVKKLLDAAYPKEFINQLRKNQKAMLPRDNVIHIKHRGVEHQPFGESMVEPVLSDIKYKRALQALEFVTIDSLVNRLVIVKVGSDDPNSDYHNIETAQARVMKMAELFGNLGPNMHIIWAGPDVEVLDVGAHSQLLDVTDRFRLAHERIELGLGIPKALLDGSSSGGQIWASYEGYRETLRGIQNAWVQAMTTLGERIASMNGYEDVELVYMPNRSLLADQQAGADLALRAYKTGVMSLHRVIPELGGDYEAERRNRLIEMGYDPESSQDSLPPDNEIFSPPLGMPGDTRTDPDGNIRDPGGEPGRRPDSQREDIAPERQRENRNPNDGE